MSHTQFARYYVCIDPRAVLKPNPLQVNGSQTALRERLEAEMRLGSPRFGTVVIFLETASVVITMPNHCADIGSSRMHALDKNMQTACTSELQRTASVVLHMAIGFLSLGVLGGFLPGLVRMSRKPTPAVVILEKNIFAKAVLAASSLVGDQRTIANAAKQYRSLLAAVHLQCC